MMGISIHAPARGATPKPYLLRHDPLISIHAPARGATVIVNDLVYIRCRFQSTLPQGERLIWMQLPVRLKEFQSTLPQGERRYSINEATSSSGFQSTLPQGERLIHPAAPKPNYRFQSTLPQGERQVPSSGNAGFWRISIHAPARGATDQRVYCLYDRRISIHAPARGATDIDTMVELSQQNFNPRSRKGSDYRPRT